MNIEVAENQLVLLIDRLSVSINTKPILLDVSLNIGKNEIVGLVGESGSGKSMTALSIMGLLPKGALMQSKGGIFFNLGNQQLRLDELDEKTFRRLRGNHIAIIFQEPMTSLNPSKKCGKQIEEVLLIHKSIKSKDRKTKVLQLLTDVRLPDPENIYHLYPHQLSGGQRQRIMIAMALACNPKLLIADEPTTALDTITQKHIINLILTLQQKYSLSVLFITHDIGLVRFLCNRAYVLLEGQIVEELSRTQLLQNNYSHTYTLGLFSCRPTIASKNKPLITIQSYLNKNLQANFEISASKNISNKSDKVLVEIKQLSKDFELKSYSSRFFSLHFKAVNQVNLTIYRNETLGLVGLSGCGKTTLARLILRLTEPTFGQVMFNGEDIYKYSTNELRNFRKKAQIIFQDPYSSLHPTKKIINSLLEPLVVHNILNNKKSRIEYIVFMLEKTGLNADCIYKYPHEFSGGQRQRICIARALLLKPEFIVCDEPVSSLDMSIQAQVINLLNELKKEFGLTYLFISHDLSLVYYMSDRIAVMNKGQIIEVDTAYKILYESKETYTRQLIDSAPEKFIDNL